MPLDYFNNWYPILPDNPSPVNSYGELISGSGVPDNGLGNNGDVYININNGDIYSKAGDVWIVSGSVGGSGSGQIKYYISDPNSEGVVPDDQTRPAIAGKKDGTGSIVTWNVTTLLWN